MTDTEKTVTVRYNGQPAWGDTYHGRYVIALGQTADMPESHAQKLMADFGEAFTVIKTETRAIDTPPRDRMKRKSANKRGGRR
jgi:cytochrome c-type biogenesis protein CcmE